MALPATKIATMRPLEDVVHEITSALSREHPKRQDHSYQLQRLLTSPGSSSKYQEERR
jgi:hypothetical protein